MRRIISGLIAILLLIAIAVMPADASAANVSGEQVETAMRRGLDWLIREVPSPRFGSVGGEWTVLTLARSGHTVPDGYFEDYIIHIGNHLDSLTEVQDPNSTAMHHGNAPNGNKVFNPATERWEPRLGNQAQATENARLAIALTSLGLDATAFVSPQSGNTYDLISRLGNRHNAASGQMLGELQGTNGPAWSLIAINARGWDNPYTVSSRAWVGGTTAGNPVTVDERISWLLSRTLNTGGWDLSGSDRNQTHDPDMTAMIIQSLAPYYDRPAVRTAIDNALDALSRSQRNSGGWISGMGAETVENVQTPAQVIVALTALGIDPQTDPRFTKPGGNPVTSVLRFQNPATGAFTHPHISDGGEDNLMATDQATYALGAYRRLKNDMNRLYDMSDAAGQFNFGNLVAPERPDFGLVGRHPDVAAVEVIHPGRTFGDIQGHANQAAIEALASRGIITGITDTAFYPDATLTRAQFSAIVTRALGLPVRVPDVILPDVPLNAWFAEAARTAFYYDIVRGTTAQRPILFSPDGTMTRQEAAVMIVRAARLAGMDTEVNQAEIINILSIFGDYRRAADWAWAELAFCVREGILDDEEFYLEPLALIRRGEIAEMLHRMMDRANLV